MEIDIKLSNNLFLFTIILFCLHILEMLNFIFIQFLRLINLFFINITIIIIIILDLIFL